MAIRSSVESVGAANSTRALGPWPWSPEGGALPAASPPEEDSTLVGADETRHRLLGIAADLFRRKGFARATTRELAALLGLKKASLYHYVSSKQELLYDICIDSLNTISDEVRRAIDEAPQPDRLVAAIRAHVETACRDQAMHAVMLIELRALAPERYTEVVDARSAYEQQLRAVAAGRAEGWPAARRRRLPVSDAYAAQPSQLDDLLVRPGRGTLAARACGHAGPPVHGRGSYLSCGRDPGRSRLAAPVRPHETPGGDTG